MASNKMDDICRNCSLKMTPKILPKEMQLILKLLLVVSAICFLVFCITSNSFGDTKSMPEVNLRAMKCEFDESVICRVKYPFSGIAVEVSCSFLDRIRILNAVLDHLRLSLLRRIHSKEWKNLSDSETIKFIGGSDDNFLQKLENFSQIETVCLPFA